MNGKLIIGPFDKDTDFYQTNVSKAMRPYDYEISILTPLEGNFEELISKPYDFEESIDFNIDVIDDDLDNIKFLEKIKNNRIEYIKNINDIIFYYEPKEIAEFIKKNPILKTKRIIFEDYFDLDPKLVNDISEAFGDDTSNLYFQISGNDCLISFKEYKDTIYAINQRIKEIEKYNFSTLEKIMYVYDMVRDKVYVEVDKNEDKMISRNLSSALLGDKIVCLGYATIFRTLLEKLGIECRNVILLKPNQKNGHARNVIFINDDKYGIHGVYYFDPTWDNKKSDLDNNFLYSYKHFAVTKERMDEIDRGRLVEKSFPYFSSDIAYEFEEIVEDNGFEGLSDEMIKSINHMSYLVDGDTLIFKDGFNRKVPDILKPNKEKVYKKLVEIVEYFDNPISADIMLKVLYNVRKYQYYLNPNKYPFGLNDFCKTVFCSEWNFDCEPLEMFALELCDSAKERGKIRVNQTIRYTKKTNMCVDIERVKLAKTLRKVYEQKRNS